VIVSRKPSFFSFFKLGEFLFFPSFCKLCAAFLDKPGEKVICRTCWEELRPAAFSGCLRCGRFYAGSESPPLCPNCLASPGYLTIHRSCGRYEGKLKDIILLFKYKRMKILGRDLAAFIHRGLDHEKDLWRGIDAVIPVPLHPRKKRERGYNQAKVLAAELARLRGFKLLDGPLAKIRNTPSQASLEANKRQDNVRGVYRTVSEKDLKGKVVLLVDDVFTTGATLGECSRVLKRAGAKEIRAVTVAQA